MMAGLPKQDIGNVLFGSEQSGEHVCYRNGRKVMDLVPRIPQAFQHGDGDTDIVDNMLVAVHWGQSQSSANGDH